MDCKQNSTMEEALSIEQGPVKKTQVLDTGVNSAHTIDHDSWMQVGLLLATSFNCGWILTFSNLILVPLGWAWGITCLFVVGFFTAYANWLLAGFHFINGQRFIRYRDLMGYLYGTKMMYLTWGLQFFTLLLGNMGFILLGGRTLKAIDAEFNDSPMRLQYFVVMTGAAFFVFSVLVPTISAMRRWLGITAFITITYIVLLLVVVVEDGKANRTRDYSISGSKDDKVFSALGAISAIIVCNTTGLLPEIQSTLRRPAVINIRKALYVQYTVGLAFYYGVSIVGYWAYGSAVSEFLPNEMNGSRWMKVFINTAVFTQSIVSQHMFISPVHEAFDTKFLNLEKGIHSKENIGRLICLRAFFFTGNTLVAAAFPFMGDFVNLLGSFALVPLTFVFPSMIFIKIKGKTAGMTHKIWHWANIFLFSLLAVATTISAVRLIVNNVRKYNFFADT